MATDLKCFEWKMGLSDLLDGKQGSSELSGHVANCPSCTEKQKNIVLIIRHLKAESFSSLSDQQHEPGRSKTPWYIRSGLEGIGIAMIVIVFTTIGVPKLQKIYEANLDHRMESFDLADLSESKMETEIRQTTPDPQPSLVADEPELPASEPSSDDALTPVDEQATAMTEQGTLQLKKVKPANNQFWRFHIKADNAQDVRAKITLALKALDLGLDEKALTGTDVPGGIQFNFLAAKERVVPIGLELQKISSVLPTLAIRPDLVSIFTWVRSQSKHERLPAGRSRVVIFIAQI